MFYRLLKRQEQRSRLFGEMMRRFWFDPHRDMTSSEASTLHQAILRCRACGATDRCQTWMDSTEGTEGADQFCPNVRAFRTLAAEVLTLPARPEFASPVGSCRLEEDHHGSPD